MCESHGLSPQGVMGAKCSHHLRRDCTIWGGEICVQLLKTTDSLWLRKCLRHKVLEAGRIRWENTLALFLRLSLGIWFLASVRQTVQLRGPFVRSCFHMLVFVSANPWRRARAQFLFAMPLVWVAWGPPNEILLGTLFSKILVLQSGKLSVVGSQHPHLLALLGPGTWKVAGGLVLCTLRPCDRSVSVFGRESKGRRAFCAPPNSCKSGSWLQRNAAGSGLSHTSHLQGEFGKSRNFSISFSQLCCTFAVNTRVCCGFCSARVEASLFPFISF